MKNLKTFEEFINESIEPINEYKTFSPANIKEYGINKSSLDKLKKWSFKINDLDIKFVEIEDYYNKNFIPAIFVFLDIRQDRYNMYPDRSGYIIISVNGENFRIQIEKKPSKLGFYEEYDLIRLGIKETEFAKYILAEEDKIEGLINLLTDMFKTYAKEFEELISTKIGLPSLHVIRVGEVAPATGKTPHGWSIYDQPTSVIGMFGNSGGFYAAANTFKVGDKFKVFDDQNGKLLWKEVTIKEIVPCNYDSFVRYSRSVGAKIPVKAFQKQTGKFGIDIWSVK